MGCDIHPYAERKTDNGWEKIEGLHPFDWRSYGMFGFLANVRNYSAVPPLSEPRDLPDDISDAVRAESESWKGDGHSHSWLSVAELSAFNYDADMEDRRVSRRVNGYIHGGCTCDPGEGENMTYRQFLCEDFFDDIKKLQDAGAGRIVFWFDN